MLVTWYDFFCHSDVTSLPPLYRYPLSIAWLRVRVARYTHPVYSPSGSCHSDVTSLPPLLRYPLSIAWLRVRVARYTFLFSLAWPWRMKSLVKHNMLKKQTLIFHNVSPCDLPFLGYPAHVTSVSCRSPSTEHRSMLHNLFRALSRTNCNRGWQNDAQAWRQAAKFNLLKATGNCMYHEV